ncbi:unnamed protein product [Adineta steineri]|uniref:mRNA export factor GLE1 n=1 Tax=Adineta steineri TaxID=433720 RepID=A0A818IZ62_9BILA|nr:unnamed protein product [Adineta steineri]
MDEIYENRLIYYRRIEKRIKDVEENEAKTNKAMEQIRQQSESNPISFGPANDLIRFFYILEQQYQSDSDEIRTKTKEDLLEYLDQFRTTNDEIDNEENDDEEDQEPEESVEIQQSEPISLPMIPPPTTISPKAQPLSTESIPLQLPSVSSSKSQPLSNQSLPMQQPSVDSSTFAQAASATPVLSQPSSDKPQLSSTLSPVTSPSCITPGTLKNYEKLLSEAQQYKKCFETIDKSRKNLLMRFLKETLNKLRTDTYNVLKSELFQYLNGQKSILDCRISSDEERLLCLSMLAKLILRQLLGGDLDDKKTEVLLPLIRDINENKEQTEFRIIFLDCLHERCPYTVPLYPERTATMDDIKYKLALGYVVKKEGDQERLETNDEFLNRMNGFIRLFCKLLVNRIPPFDDGSTFVWTWCSDVLNLPPRPDLTALLLRVFLQEAGDMMIKTYPPQFQKIINTIRKKENFDKIVTGASESEKSQLAQALDKFPKKT